MSARATRSKRSSGTWSCSASLSRASATLETASRPRAVPLKRQKRHALMPRAPVSPRHRPEKMEAIGR